MPANSKKSKKQAEYIVLEDEEEEVLEDAGLGDNLRSSPRLVSPPKFHEFAPTNFNPFMALGLPTAPVSVDAIKTARNRAMKHRHESKAAQFGARDAWPFVADINNAYDYLTNTMQSVGEAVWIWQG